MNAVTDDLASQLRRLRHQPVPSVLRPLPDTWPDRGGGLAQLLAAWRGCLPTGSALADALHRLAQRSLRGTGGWPAPRSLAARFDVDLAPAGWRLGAWRIFAGVAGAMTPMHSDSGHGLNVHLAGVKRWRLLPPDRGPVIGARPLHEGSGILMADPRASAGTSSTSDWLELDVHAGEAMFVPSGWFHEVRLLDDAASVAAPLFEV